MPPSVDIEKGVNYFAALIALPPIHRYSAYRIPHFNHRHRTDAEKAIHELPLPIARRKEVTVRNALSTPQLPWSDCGQAQ
jgi:hypothetical protein